MGAWMLLMLSKLTRFVGVLLFLTGAGAAGLTSWPLLVKAPLPIPGILLYLWGVRLQARGLVEAAWGEPDGRLAMKGHIMERWTPGFRGDDPERRLRR